jgi:hypothetical protein
MGSGGDYSGMAASAGTSEAMSGGDEGGGGGITDIMGGGDSGSSMPTTDYGGGGDAASGSGGGVGMLSFAVSDNMSGLSGADTSSTKVSTTPAEAGAALDKSTTPVNAGGGTGASASSTGGTAQAGKQAQTPGATYPPPDQPGPKAKTSNEMFKDATKAGLQEMNRPDDPSSAGKYQYQMPNTTYGALFGSTNLISKQSMPSSQVAPIQSAPIAQPIAPIQPMQSPAGSLPPPMPLQMQAPQAPQIPLAQIPQMGTMSDERAKQRIKAAHKDMEALLQRVYDNVTSKRKR